MSKQIKKNIKETDILTQGSNKNPLIKISINVFTIYVGLVASGYDLSLDKELAERIRAVKWDKKVTEYFRMARSTYCDVNPYWPRGSMLVSACLTLEESKEYKYSDFEKLMVAIDGFNNIDPNEKDEKTKLWLYKLPEYYRLIRENVEFSNLWTEYLKRTEAVIPQFVEAFNDAKERVIFRFHIDEAQLPKVFGMPNILGNPYNADFERIDNAIYVVSARLNSSSIIHEYLHNILEHGIRNSLEVIKEYKHLINPVFEHMLSYKYAWAKDELSWCRVFEESLVRATTIWVNNLDQNDLALHSKKEEDMGFIYVPVLVEQLGNSQFCINGFEKFINSCLEACECKYKTIPEI